MKIRMSVLATAAAATICTGAFALPAAASTHTTTQTLQFTARRRGDP